MKTPQAIIASAAIIAGAILIQNVWSSDGDCAGSDGSARYVALSTDATIRVNVIDTQTGAVRHCWTEDYGADVAKCSEWVGLE